MKQILLIILIALKVQANEITVIKNEVHTYEIVEKLLAQGNDFEAIQKLKLLLDTDKKNQPYLLEKLSKIHVANDLTGRFISFLKSKIEKSPFDTALNYQLAKEYLHAQKPFEACDTAKFMLSHVSNKEDFYSILAECSLTTHGPAESISYLDKLSLEHSNDALSLKRAELHLKLNNLAQAKSDLDFYFLKAKPEEKAYLLQAELYTKQQLSEKLPELYKRCLETIGVSQNCFLGYLTATRNLNAIFKIEHFNKHRKFYQDYPAMLLEIGRHYQQVKNFEQAEAMYLLAHNSQRDKIEAISMLFDLYDQQNQSQKAFDLLERFIVNTKNVENLQTAQTLQNALFHKGDMNTAVNLAPPSNQRAPLPKVAEQSNVIHQLYLEKKYSEILPHLKKIKPKSDSEYFLLGNVYFHLSSYGNAKLNWGKVTLGSSLYYKALFNTIVTMRIENMKTVSTNLFNSTEFPLEMYSQTRKFAELLAQFSKRLPANERKKIDELGKSLLYLEWEL